MTYRLICNDAIKAMKKLPDDSIDLIATDPPYFRVVDHAWDRQWKSDVEFITWIRSLCEQWQRVLKPNGSIYVFASPQMRSRVELAIADSFRVLNTITWAKPEGRHLSHRRSGLRKYATQTEAIIFAEQYTNKAAQDAEDAIRRDTFEPVRSYLNGERIKAGVTLSDINGYTKTHMAGHWFTSHQWSLPSEERYKQLQTLFNRNMKPHSRLRQDYRILNRKYLDLKSELESLRRVFDITDRDQAFTDVWNYSTVHWYEGKRPCEKPLYLCRNIIELSSRPGDVVLDSFAGSGSFGVAASQLGRSFIGIDFDQQWCRYARSRIRREGTLQKSKNQAVAA